MLPDNTQAIGPTYEISAGSINFKGQVVIRLPVAVDEKQSIIVLRLDEVDATEWEQINPVAIVGGVAEIEVGGLGYFQVVLDNRSTSIDDAGMDAIEDAEVDGVQDAGLDAGYDADESGGHSDIDIDSGTSSSSSSSGSSSIDKSGDIWYVDDDRVGGNGRSWANAFTTLQDALNNPDLESGDQIWVAEGIYTPAPAGGDRVLSFNLVNGVEVYGGFNGTETSLVNRNDIYTLNHVSVLSGDLNSDDYLDEYGNFANIEENAYHVVVCASGARLDGFAIGHGNANGPRTDQQRGGGIYVEDCDGFELVNVGIGRNSANDVGGAIYIAPGSYSKLEITHAVVSPNVAAKKGGGIYISDGSTQLTDVVFAQNRAETGGGMYNEGGDPVITNVTFCGNTASGIVAYGGGLYSHVGSPLLTNVIFAGNSVVGTEAYGGAIFFESGMPVLTNSTLSGNVAIGEEGNGGGIYTEDPSGISQVLLENSILWGNSFNSTISEIDIGSSNFIISHSNIRGCGESKSNWNESCGMDSGGNLDTLSDPFTDIFPSTGIWTLDSDSSDNLQTVFTDTSANWIPGELVGMFLQPDENSASWIDIVKNTENTITVFGVILDAISSGTIYQIHNLSLDIHSSCVNGGSNAVLPFDALDLDSDHVVNELLSSDIKGRPRIADVIVDMGAYESGYECVTQVVTESSGLIDDLSDGDSQILLNDDRNGFWYIYNDGTGIQSPQPWPDEIFVPINGMACTSGNGFSEWGAGIGLHLYENHNNFACQYDASNYSGVSFDISGTILKSRIRFEISTADTTPTKYGGNCFYKLTCEDHYGIYVNIGSIPQTVMVSFSELQQEGWGTPGNWNASQILGMSWEVYPLMGSTAEFSDLCIDNVQLF